MKRLAQKPCLPAPAPARDPSQAARRLEAAALELGFVAAGIAPAVLPAPEPERLLAWLAAGHHGDMDWLAERAAERADARALLPGARSVLMVALPHEPERRARPDPTPPTGRGYVASYAAARLDYHRVVAARLEALERFVADLLPGERARRFCDTTPLLERAFARAAGLGFVGKNGCLIDPRRGSFLFLGGLALTAALPPDGPQPDATGGCGTCTRCLEACPTAAFPAPWVLDARRCLSYLTIEKKGSWPEELRAAAGTHVFGCDLCQTVCPWNKFSPPADPELAPDPARREPELLPLLRRARDAFKGLARGTPWERAGKRGLLRNAITALGNAGRREPEVVAELEALAGHEDEGVRAHARWALARLAGGEAEEPAP